LNCPHCGQSFEALEGQRFCSFCGSSLERSNASGQTTVSETNQLGGPAESQYQDGSRRPGEPYVPWEDIENVGFFQGLILTARGSVFSPAEFFSRMPLRRGLLNPLTYGLILETVGNMAGYLSGFLVENPLFPQAHLTGSLMMIVGVLIPVIAGLWLILWALLLHVSLFLVGGANEDFEASFRIVAYSSAPDLLNAVPVVGSFIALVWKLSILIPGVREVHCISTAKATAAVFLPLVCCCGVLVGGVMLVSIAAGGPAG